MSSLSSITLSWKAYRSFWYAGSAQLGLDWPLEQVNWSAMCISSRTWPHVSGAGSSRATAPHCGRAFGGPEQAYFPRLLRSLRRAQLSLVLPTPRAGSFHRIRCKTRHGPHIVAVVRTFCRRWHAAKFAMRKDLTGVKHLTSYGRYRGAWKVGSWVGEMLSFGPSGFE